MDGSCKILSNEINFWSTFIIPKSFPKLSFNGNFYAGQFDMYLILFYTSCLSSEGNSNEISLKMCASIKSLGYLEIPGNITSASLIIFKKCALAYRISWVCWPTTTTIWGMRSITLLELMCDIFDWYYCTNDSFRLRSKRYTVNIWRN
jgi:hypothetical protein